MVIGRVLPIPSKKHHIHQRSDIIFNQNKQINLQHTIFGIHKNPAVNSNKFIWYVGWHVNYQKQKQT